MALLVDQVQIQNMAFQNTNNVVVTTLSVSGNDIGSGLQSAFATANAALNGITGLVINDTVTSTSKTQVASANSVNTVWATAQAAFVRANSGGGSGVPNTTGYMTGTLTVNNLTANVGINTNVIVANTTIFAPTVNAQSLIGNVVNVGGTYILTMKDSGSVIYYNNANPLTVNTANNLLVNFRCAITQVNTGLVTIQAGPGTQVVCRTIGNNSIASQFTSVTIVQPFSNTFILDGGIASSIFSGSLTAFNNFAQAAFNEANNANSGLIGSTTQTVNYTIQTTDVGTCIEVNNTAGPCFITVPTFANAAIANGSVIEIFQMGSGQAALIPQTSAVTLRYTTSANTRTQNSTIGIRCRATNDFTVFGDTQ